jgi:tRNA(Ile)-lysidine synthase
VAHLHHHIRGSAADADAAFVRALARRLDLPCEVAHSDVPAQARAARQSIEVAGRNARLDFYRQALGRLEAHRMALAHTRGDQAETVLLRLARGAGPRGLGGMAPRSGHRIRPLLEVRRQALRDWLASQHELWCEDETNQDVAVVRNRIRHQVIPALTLVNARVEEALARAARIQAADANLLDELARLEAGRLLTREDGRVALPAAALRQLPEALARRVLLRAFEAADPVRAYGWDHTEAVLRSSPGTRLDFGRIRLELNRDFVVLTIGVFPPSLDGAGLETPTLTLDVPGSVRHPLGWWTVEAEGPLAFAQAAPPASDRAVLDAAAVGGHLQVRGWRHGDRVQPLGLGGRKKLQDLFVDRKVPRDQRPMVPVVLSVGERIAWVAGHAIGEAFRATSHSSAVVVLTLRR